MVAPTNAGEVKWVEEVIASSSGRSLKRRTAADYAMTANTEMVSHRADIQVPAA